MSHPLQLALDDLEAVFSALSSAPRRHILLVLHFRGGEMSAGDIQGRFGCTWATTSRHLRVLREAGLVTVRRDGRERFYGMVPERFNVVQDWVRRFESSEE